MTPKRGTDDHGISIDHDNHDHDDHNDHDDHGISIELWYCKQIPPQDKSGLVCISTTPSIYVETLKEAVHKLQNVAGGVIVTATLSIDIVR